MSVRAPVSFAAAALTLLALAAYGPYRCEPVPQEPVHDDRCDDGTEPLCEMVPPVCDDQWEILAYQGNCYVCVNPTTCVPWGEPGCRDDRDCDVTKRCDSCATGSCPMCLDCVAGCVPHGCPTEDEPLCNMIRPLCDGGVAVVRDGCWVCVGLGACAPMRDESCDDGTQPMCLMIPPICDEHEILAHQDNCYRCVNPATCLPWGTAECRSNADCPRGEICDFCGSSSCPFCDDCVAACRQSSDKRSALVR